MNRAVQSSRLRLSVCSMRSLHAKSTPTGESYAFFGMYEIICVSSLQGGMVSVVADEIARSLFARFLSLLCFLPLVQSLILMCVCSDFESQCVVDKSLVHSLFDEGESRKKKSAPSVGVTSPLTVASLANILGGGELWSVREREESESKNSERREREGEKERGRETVRERDTERERGRKRERER